MQNIIHQGHSDPGTSGQVYGLHVHTNAPVAISAPDMVFVWDQAFVTDEVFTPNYYHNDYLGSARRITNSSGNVVWSRDYYPFGEERNASGIGNRYKFTGNERDEEIGLDKNGTGKEIMNCVGLRKWIRSGISVRGNRCIPMLGITHWSK